MSNNNNNNQQQDHHEIHHQPFSPQQQQQQPQSPPHQHNHFHNAQLFQHLQQMTSGPGAHHFNQNTIFAAAAASRAAAAIASSPTLSPTSLASPQLSSTIAALTIGPSSPLPFNSPVSPTTASSPTTSPPPPPPPPVAPISNDASASSSGSSKKRRFNEKSGLIIATNSSSNNNINNNNHHSAPNNNNGNNNNNTNMIDFSVLSSFVVPFKSRAEHSLESLPGRPRQCEALLRATALRLKSSHQRKIACTMLLHGKHGSGKTYLAKALANSLHATLVNVTLPKLIGGDESVIYDLFNEAWSAAQVTPVVMVFDYCEILFSEHRVQMSSLILSCLEDVNTRSPELPLFTVFITREVGNIDQQIMDFFDVKIEVPLPNEEERSQFFEAEINRHNDLLVAAALEAEIATATAAAAAATNNGSHPPPLDYDFVSARRQQLSENRFVINKDQLSLLIERSEGASFRKMAQLVSDAFEEASFRTHKQQQPQAHFSPLERSSPGDESPHTTRSRRLSNASSPPTLSKSSPPKLAVKPEWRDFAKHLSCLSSNLQDKNSMSPKIGAMDPFAAYDRSPSSSNNNNNNNNNGGGGGGGGRSSMGWSKSFTMSPSLAARSNSIMNHISSRNVSSSNIEREDEAARTLHGMYSSPSLESEAFDRLPSAFVLNERSGGGGGGGSSSASTTPTSTPPLTSINASESSKRTFRKPRTYRSRSNSRSSPSLAPLQTQHHQHHRHDEAHSSDSDEINNNNSNSNSNSNNSSGSNSNSSNSPNSPSITPKKKRDKNLFKKKKSMMDNILYYDKFLKSMSEEEKKHVAPSTKHDLEVLWFGYQVIEGFVDQFDSMKDARNHVRYKMAEEFRRWKKAGKPIDKSKILEVVRQQQQQQQQGPTSPSRSPLPVPQTTSLSLRRVALDASGGGGGGDDDNSELLISPSSSSSSSSSNTTTPRGGSYHLAQQHQQHHRGRYVVRTADNQEEVLEMSPVSSSRITNMIIDEEGEEVGDQAAAAEEEEEEEEGEEDDEEEDDDDDDDDSYDDGSNAKSILYRHGDSNIINKAKQRQRQQQRQQQQPQAGITIGKTLASLRNKTHGSASSSPVSASAGSPLLLPPPSPLPPPATAVGLLQAAAAAATTSTATPSPQPSPQRPSSSASYHHHYHRHHHHHQ